MPSAIWLLCFVGVVAMVGAQAPAQQAPYCLCDARTPTIVPSLFAVKPTVSDPMIIYGKCIKTVTCTTTSRGFIPSVSNMQLVSPWLCHATTSNVGDSCTAVLHCNDRGQWIAETCTVNAFTDVCHRDGRSAIITQATCL